MAVFQSLVNRIKYFFKKPGAQKPEYENNCFKCIEQLILNTDNQKLENLVPKDITSNAYITVEDNMGVSFLIKETIKSVDSGAEIYEFSDQDTILNFLLFINSVSRNQKSVDQIKLIILDITLKSIFRAGDMICNLNGICLATWLQKNGFEDKWVLYTGNDVYSNYRILTDIENLYNKVTDENLFESNKILFKSDGLDNLLTVISKAKNAKKN